MEPKVNENVDGGAVNSDTPARGSAFTTEYVKELREEAASWRTKYRDTERKYNELDKQVKEAVTTSKIEQEINKRGLKINPSFIKLGDDKDPVKAVDSFLEEYPQFAGESVKETVRREHVKPISTEKKNTNMTIKSDSVMEVKNDPIARAKLRDHYRALMNRGS